MYRFKIRLKKENPKIKNDLNCDLKKVNLKLCQTKL